MAKVAARLVLFGAAVCWLPSASAFVPGTSALRTSYSAPPVAASHTGRCPHDLRENRAAAAASAPLSAVAASPYNGRLGLHMAKATSRGLTGVMKMTTTTAAAVDIVEEGGGGGGGSDVEVVSEEFGVKTDLLKQIDLASSSQKR